jgi:GH18 family chitinase
MKKNFLRLILAAAVVALGFAQTACTGKSKTDSETKAKVDSVHPRIIIAYVTSGSDVMPDPNSMTHINYAFGHVNQTFNGIDVANPDRLHQISALKQQNPDLKVILSVGGWGSGRFSEMAADSLNRTAFAADAKRVIDEFNLDGVDIDWEYPTSSSAGISSSPDDTDNYPPHARHPLSNRP